MLETYEVWQQRLESAKEEYHHSKGVIDQLKKRLLEEFNFDSFDQAEEYIESLQQKISKLKNRLEKEVESFHETWTKTVSKVD